MTVLKTEFFLHITLITYLIMVLWVQKETNGLSDNDCLYNLEEDSMRQCQTVT